MQSTTRYVFRTTCLLLAVVTLPVNAAPPPGHPTPAQAREMLLPENAPRASELPNQGKVLDVIHANEFTYVQVALAQNQDKVWIAVQKTELKVGTTVRYDDGAVMNNFYSKLLKRTFPSVMFVDHLAIVAQP